MIILISPRHPRNYFSPNFYQIQKSKIKDLLLIDDITSMKVATNEFFLQFMQFVHLNPFQN